MRLLRWEWKESRGNSREEKEEEEGLVDAVGAVTVTLESVKGQIYEDRTNNQIFFFPPFFRHVLLGIEQFS